MKKLSLLLSLTFVTASPSTASITGASGPLTLAALERMTPVQLQGVTPDQVERLLVEADSEVIRVGDSWNGRQDKPYWPNPDRTMFYAVVNAYEAYERDQSNTHTGPDWTSDGCSFPVAAAYKKAFDAHACRHHDYGYRNLAQYRGAHNEIIRKALDLRLLTDLHFQCLTDDSLNVKQHACDLAALAAYVQARKTGQAVFNATPARYP